MSTRRAALLRAGQTPLEPLHATVTGGTHAMSESHQTAVDSRVASDPTSHLDRALARHRPWVNQTSSRVACRFVGALLPPCARSCRVADVGSVSSAHSDRVS